MNYIQALGKAAPMFVEYDTVRPDGLLLRITGAASPDQANSVAAAFTAS
jgi:hypothetical protein